jgi:DNA-binding NarL/FixJ family response regulator
LLSQRFTTVRYDGRGAGYSQRDGVDDISVEAYISDLEAVVGQMDAGPFVLFGYLQSAHNAPLYAAKHPASVSRLILWPPDVRNFSSAEYRALGELLTNDWDTFTETYAHLAVGWEKGELANAYARLLRESVTPEMFSRHLAEGLAAAARVKEVVGHVRMPVLIVQRRLKYSAERVAELAAGFPNARLQILDGEANVPYVGNARAVVDVMARFAGGAGISTSVTIDADPPAASQFTAQERHILRLLVEGRSNQEMADELVLSVRTVERHLYNIYNKLGVTGRSARAAAAAVAVSKGLI